MERTNRKLSLFVALLLGTCVVSSARADSDFGGSEYSPTPFTYAFDGFWDGALVGSSVGYIVARQDGFKQGDWRPMVMGAGIGALAGAGLGLTLGFIDAGIGRPTIGGVVLRDMFAGSCLGLLLGVVGGSLAVIKTREPEHIGYGAAIGTLSGAGAGMIIGFIEGPRLVRRRPPRGEAMRVLPSVAIIRDSKGSSVALPSLTASF